MKKTTIIFVMLFLLCVCRSKVKESVTLTIFTVENCGYCEIFEQQAVPYLQDRFENLTMIYKDLDQDQKEYDSLISQLDHFDQNEYGSTPLIVYEDHFVIVGYELGDEKDLYEDIVHTLNHEPLGEKLQAYRWEFKQ